jgi:hypothetical protein
MGGVPAEEEKRRGSVGHRREEKDERRGANLGFTTTVSTWWGLVAACRIQSMTLKEEDANEWALESRRGWPRVDTNFFRE